MASTIRFARAGGPEVLEFVDFPDADPGPHEVRIRVRAIGITRAVTGRTDGVDTQGGTEHELETKLILGHDFSDRFNVAFNWINEVKFENGKWEFGYAAGLNYTVYRSSGGERMRIVPAISSAS